MTERGEVYRVKPNKCTKNDEQLSNTEPREEDRELLELIQLLAKATQIAVKLLRRKR